MKKSIDDNNKERQFVTTFQLSIFQLYLLFDKRKIQNGRFPQIELAGRGGKRQERKGYSLSNLDKV